MPVLTSQANSSATSRYGAQFLNNIIFSLLGPLTSLLVRVAFLGYIVHCLGQERFGLITLGLSIQSILILFRLGAAAGVGKKLNACKVQGDMDGFKIYFSTGVVISIASALIIAVALGLIVTLLWSFFNVPIKYNLEGRFVVSAVGACGILMALETPYSACINATHRLDIHQKVLIGSLFLRVGLTVSLFELYDASAQVYALIILISGLVDFVSKWFWVRFHNPYVSFSLSSVTWDKIYQLVTFNIFVVGNNLMQSLFLVLPVSLILRYGDLSAAGQFGIGRQMGMFVWNVLAQMNSAVSPVVVSLWAEKSQKLKVFWQMLLKAYLSLGGLFWLLLVYLTPTLMSLWLQKDAALLVDARYWLFGATFLAVINLTNGPFLLAYEKLKIPVISGTIISISMFFLIVLVCRMVPQNILLTICKLIFIFYGLYVLICFFVILRSFYLSFRRVILQAVFPALVPLLIIYGLLLACYDMNMFLGWSELIFVCVLAFISWFPLFYWITLSRSDREKVCFLVKHSCR